MWDRVKSVFARLGSAAIVKSPLWLFASCAGFICFEVHSIIGKLAETKIWGLVESAMLLAVLGFVIQTVGKVALNNPTGLYADIELLKFALKSKVTIADALGKLQSDQKSLKIASRGGVKPMVALKVGEHEQEGASHD